MPLRIDSTQLHLTDAPLGFAQRNADAIAAHWQRAVSAEDRLWNGPQYLFTDVRANDGVLSGTAHLTDFATFMYWRAYPRDGTAVHITGTSLPVTADGALLAGRMAPHTANAGLVYFPAGSLDPDDVTDGSIDIFANVRRELAEETGLTPLEAAFDPFMMAAAGDHAWFVARRCRLDLSFDDCVRHIKAHQSRTGDDEMAEIIAIRSVDDTNQLTPYARALALWHFQTTADGAVT